MRRFVLILGGLVILGVCLGVFFSGGSPERALPDGSIIRVEKITFAMAEDDEFVLGGIPGRVKVFARGLWRAVVSHSPPSPYNGSWSDDDSALHTNLPALYIYISRRVPHVGYRTVESSTAFLIDEDGCVFQSAQTGGMDDGQIATAKTNRLGMNSDVGWFRFEAFPRRDRKFRFVVVAEGSPGGGPSSSNTPTAELLISNPVKPPPLAGWSVEPIPIRRDQDGVSFTLASVKLRTNSDPDTPPALLAKSVVPNFECAENGKPSTNWRGFIEELTDVSGNFATINDDDGVPFSLCVREAAWKLRVKFFGDGNSPLASNASWTLPRLTIPGPTNSVRLSLSNTLQGASIRLTAIGGAGNFTYSNAIVLQASPVVEQSDVVSPIAWPPNWNGSNSVSKPTFRVSSRGPHLAIAVDNLTADQRLTVRAVDDHGRISYGRMFGDPPGPNYLKDLTDDSVGSFVFLDLPPDAKTVDLTFCVHTCRKAEFIFKPPERGVQPAK